MTLPLMPKATAVWLIEKTALTFTQIAEFCGMHPLEVQAIADGETRAAEARANEQAALADERAAVAETRAEVQRAKRRQAEIAGYGGDLTAYNDGKMIEKGLNPRQPTYGGTVAAPPS